ncbi:hypothetical protein [Desulfosporosinus acididurans]|uniref:hypothetical protein n=1 Tax=Desulfosporosinus acididurans TaxID=476652 RepID=UPI000649B1CE|nr:hypothetical protein [Desulfosporosinus acididurans]
MVHQETEVSLLFGLISTKQVRPVFASHKNILTITWHFSSSDGAATAAWGSTLERLLLNVNAKDP